MREIFFRGYDSIADQWMYGMPVKDEDVKGRWWLMQSERSGIIIDHPETITQYAMESDFNGNHIFIGDILSEKWKVEVYRGDSGSFMVKFHNNPKTNKPQFLSTYLAKRKQAGTQKRDNLIIGNAFENPELLTTPQKQK